MDRVRFPMGSLFLICDGSKALVFRNAGDEQAITLVAVEVRNEHHGQTRDLGEDRPGRGANSATGKRTALGETDLHDAAETAFIKQTAKSFDALVRADKTKAVAIIAPPRALGVLRDALDGATRDVARLELAKDWVRQPTLAIEANLQEMGALK